MDPQRRRSTEHAPSNSQRIADRSRRVVQHYRERHERSPSDEAREQRHLRDRHLRQNYNTHEAWAESMQGRAGIGPPRTVQLSESAQRHPYGEGTPNQQSLYDWAPAPEEGDEEELEEILGELRAQQPNTHPDILRVLGRAQLEARQAQLEVERARRSMAPPASRSDHDPSPSVHQNSLRTAAILSSVRRNRQLSARSRDLMQRYVMDRERGDQTTSEHVQDPNVSSNTWLRMAQRANEQHSNRYELNRLAWQANQRPSSNTPHPDVQQQTDADATPTQPTQNVPYIPRSAETLETLRRRYLEDPTVREAQAVARFENTLRTLNTIRDEDQDTSDLSRLMTQHSIRQAELSENGKYSVEEDVVDEVRGGSFKPPYSSFLRKGVTFAGYQQATPQPLQQQTAPRQNNNPAPQSNETSNRATLYRIPDGSGLSSMPVDPAAAAAARAVWHGGRDGASTRRSRAIPSQANDDSAGLRRRDVPTNTNTCNAQQDRWAVRVHLHNVDYDTMTLQGTMEAFNMPSGSPSQLQYPTSSIRSTQHRHGNGTNGATTTARESNPAAIHNTAAQQDRKTTTFSTYLEGELIDLDKHTLMTTNPSYHATPTDDAKYWRRLRPFSSARASRKDADEKKEREDDEGGDDKLLGELVLRSEWLTKEWREKYVLMRWKERCFVPAAHLRTPHPQILRSAATNADSDHTSASSSTPMPQHNTTPAPTPRPRGPPDENRNPSGELETHTADGSAASTPSFGLSIKGFYYVCMRRSDGAIEGLYFDPQSSPYQRLRMGVEGRGASFAAGGIC